MKISLLNSSHCNIETKTKLVTQVIDWGDGVKKINKLISELQKLDKK
jgi:hypothetical protein